MQGGQDNKIIRVVPTELAAISAGTEEGEIKLQGGGGEEPSSPMAPIPS